jgi:hypothetical protein
MDTPKPPDTAYPAMTLIGKSVAIKGDLSCDEDLYRGPLYRWPSRRHDRPKRTPPDHRAKRTR